MNAQTITDISKENMINMLSAIECNRLDRMHNGAIYTMMALWAISSAVLVLLASLGL